MTFLRKEKKMSPNGENWSMEKFENFCLQKWILAFLPFLVLFLPFFGLDTETVGNISDTIALHF
jgi:hypothetical protein